MRKLAVGIFVSVVIVAISIITLNMMKPQKYVDIEERIRKAVNG